MIEQKLKSLHEAVSALNNSQCLSILNIDEDLLDSPTTTLEYLERCRAWAQLRNIAESIPDLLNQSDSIALVGFLGHFSSGKSSLINALLDVSNHENPGYKREVGQHPTDTRITLITHRDHAQLVKQSAYTAIDAVDVVHGPALEFLEHAALVDTPGLGNEKAEHEAVTRFLHLCHVLVITIDGRRPFADKDKDFELLDTAFNRLIGVPKILVVTSAEEFLTSRSASYATDWQAEQAEAFWKEAIDRLQRDPRFQNHFQVFKQSLPLFVDSKEGFRVKEVKNALLPIVTDDAHRSRIREAQGRYVLETAGDALGVLLGYISERSENLNRLHDEAKKRADGTATALEEILQSLENSFAVVRERLKEARQAVPTDTLSIESIVTPQAISEGREAKLRNLEGGIRDALQRQLRAMRSATWRYVWRHCKARTRRWFRATANVDTNMLQYPQFELDSEATGLADESKKRGRAIIRMVNRQITSTLASSRQHLRSRTEAWEIGSSVHDIESSLDRFQRIHDDGIRSFYAYISAPSSIDLLREHGIVGFDDTGGQAVQTKSIDAINCIGYKEISKASENSKKRLRDLHRDDDDDLDQPQDAGEGWSIEDEVLEDGFCAHVTKHVKRVCQSRIDDFVSGLSTRLARYVEDMNFERVESAGIRQTIWKARRTLAGRFALVAGILLFVLLAIAEFDLSKAQALWSAIPDHRIETAVGGVLSTVVVVGLIYVIAGAKNENIRHALKSALLQRSKSGAKRRKLSTAFKAHFDESYDRLVEDLSETPLQVNHAIANGIVDRLKEESHALREAERALSELHQVMSARRELLDEFIGVVNQHLTEIPKELRDAAAIIKKDTIEAHMSRIRNAVSTVEGVKSDVKQTADIAMVSH